MKTERAGFVLDIETQRALRELAAKVNEGNVSKTIRDAIREKAQRDGVGETSEDADKNGDRSKE